MKQDSNAVPAVAGRKGIFFGWYIVAASIASNVLTTAAFYQGFQAFFLPILSTFGWSRTAISGAFSLRTVESGLLSPVIGMVADRWTARRTILVSLVFMGIAFIGLSQTRNLAMFYLFFGLASIGSSGASHGVVWAIVVSRWFSRRRGRAMGIATLGPVAGGIFVLLNTWLVGEFGWRWVVFGYGIALILSGVGLSFFARERPEPYGYAPDGAPLDAAGISAATASKGKGGQSAEAGLTAGEVLRTREFWILTVIFSSLMVGNSAFSAHQIPFFVSKNFSENGAALSVLVAGLASGVGRIVGGSLADTIDYRLLLAGLAAVMAAAFLYLMVFPVSGLLSAMPFALLYGFAWGAPIPMRPVVGRLIFGSKSMGAVFGLMSMGTLVGGVAGPLIMGYIFDETQSYQGALWIIVVLTLAAMPLLFLLKPRSRLPLTASASASSSPPAVD